MSNDKAASNPLFSAENVIKFSGSPLFLPVSKQDTGHFSPEKDLDEEGSFIGQSVTTGQEQQNLATFTLFSQKSESVSSDPFAVQSTSVSNQPLSHSNIVASVQNEPQLYVPNVSHADTAKNAKAYNLPATTTSPLYGDGPSNISAANPYSLSNAGYHSRPVFPTADQLLQPTSISTAPQPYVLQTSETMEVVNDTDQRSFENWSPTGTSPSYSDYYQSVIPHWFFSKSGERSCLWCPFSYEDSSKLEHYYQADKNGQPSADVICTDGGRYDVSLSQRMRNSVYWDEPSSTIRRCTWFYKGDNENFFSPYEEDMANKLEIEYENIVKQGFWHKEIDLGNKESVVVHNPQVIVHHQPDPFGGDFGSVHDKSQRSKTVKRGISATDYMVAVPANESGTPDHLVFFCHGVGPVCDLRSRSIVECVDDFRGIQSGLLESHFKQAVSSEEANRIEFLPIHWHRALHGDATGVDRNIRRLTLPSISRLRHFTNETLLDILFYSSPVYCQTIAETVGNEINFLYQRFLSRNPDFTGKVSLVGHSLGSLILFDLLFHQSEENFEIKSSHSLSSLKSSLVEHATEVASSKTSSKKLTLDEVLQKLNLTAFQSKFEYEQIDMDTLIMCSEDDLKSIGLPLGPRKKLMGYLKEYQGRLAAENNQVLSAPNSSNVELQKAALHTSDSVDNSNSILSGATNVHVDFQQFDSGTGQPFVSYPKLDFKPHALFALGSPIGMFLTVRGIGELGEEFTLPTCHNFINIFHPFDPVAYRVEPLINPDVVLAPVLIPHHKGRKRLHLELKESLGRMGQELKDGIVRSVRLAIGSMQKFAQSHWNQAAVEEEVKHATEELMMGGQDGAAESEDNGSASSDLHDDVSLGKLNGGKRIDHVLQERPLESFNDYLFAFQSHLCYWNSEDTVLLIMKETYEAKGVNPDKKPLSSVLSQDG